MPLHADNWPITYAPLQYPAVTADGPAQDAEPEQWYAVFREIAGAGFSNVDLTDSWVRVADLPGDRLDAFSDAAVQAGLGMPALSCIRRSVIDAENGQANLAYSHRAIDAAARLGVGLVSVGLHQALTEAQREQLWFWTVTGHVDPDDAEIRALAVARLRELGRHAAENGILLSLEMYEDTYLGTADSAVRLVEEIALDTVGLNPDTANLLRLHRPIEPWREVLEKTLPYANYWHVKNYLRDEDVARDSYVSVPAPLELGLINYRQAVGIALAAGYQGAFCAEHYGGDGLGVSAINQAYLRRILPATDDYVLPRSRVAQLPQAGPVGLGGPR
jgi:sugar phosphate isomerase/epimerase